MVLALPEELGGCVVFSESEVLVDLSPILVYLSIAILEIGYRLSLVVDGDAMV
jgi:hypothetical protein